MTEFVQAALSHGADRFVLLSASLLPMGGPGPGQVHQWLQQSAAQWAVLRPSCFMQNFSEGQHLATIRDEGAIYSATGDGRVPFIDAQDIAAAAFAALTVHQPPNRDFLLTGPRPMGYDEVAALISRATGRTIRHQRIRPEDLASRHEARGLPALAARILAAMDVSISGGAEDHTTDAIQVLTGRGPVTLGAFVEAHASAWRMST
jgi:uncharacterized protein YbjT (DUF2867 family)